jgi:CRP-like cAMP-binding protein
MYPSAHIAPYPNLWYYFRLMIWEKSVYETVSRCGFLQNLTPDQCQSVIDAGQPCHIPQGSFFFHQGSPAKYFYILISGQVKLLQIDAEGRQVILTYFGPGDGLGIIVVLSQLDYPISAEAVEDCFALSWDSQITRHLMLRYPQLAINGMELVVNQFTQLQDRYHQLVTRRVEQRVARTVLQLVQQFGKKVPEGILVDISLTRQDLAEMTGTNLYNVSRIFSKWEQDGIVQSGRKRVVLCKPHDLVVIADDITT